jgi:hypothetical protein
MEGVMRAAALVGVVGALALGLVFGSATGAAAQVWYDNDTGGLIPWSCENEAWAPQIAANACAQYRKYARITSVHRQYGNFIGFHCLWNPYIEPYALPAVATRACPAQPGVYHK